MDGCSQSVVAPLREAWRRCQTISSSIARVAGGGITWLIICRTMRSQGELWLGAFVLSLTMWSGTWLCLTLCCVMEGNLAPSKYPWGGRLPSNGLIFFSIKVIAVNDWCEHILTDFASTCECDNAIVGMSLALLYEYNFTHCAWIQDPNVIYHLQDYGPWIMYFIFSVFNRLHSQNIAQWCGPS